MINLFEQQPLNPQNALVFYNVINQTFKSFWKNYSQLMSYHILNKIAFKELYMWEIKIFM